MEACRTLRWTVPCRKRAAGERSDGYAGARPHPASSDRTRQIASAPILG
ncbi:hypothetical protein trd_A0088 (plasmid) [Thermomicrobium roseum DSM 5159]|uniref:Uncharacterized protein n=1 Tax=Thermomicrobium roseum (strain ATCC 27502 / DSM 5159 / P-2) TaxID=309801 RepID=B9L5G1_THERP|nr:hypothetical protein trd_A0088 [Thermomicrobium roseum DSM 5159]